MNESQMHATYFIIYIKSIRSGYIPYKNISKILSYSSLNMHPEGANNLWLNNVNRWVVQHLQIAIQNKKSPKVCTFFYLFLFSFFTLLSKCILLHFLSYSFFCISIFYSLTRNYYGINEKCQPFGAELSKNYSSQSTISSSCLAFS